YWSLWRCWDQMTKEHPFYSRFAFLRHTEKAYPLCQSADEAITLSRSVVAESAQWFKTRRTHGYGGVLGLDGIVRAVKHNHFSDDPDAPGKFRAYLQEMVHHRDPVV